MKAITSKALALVALSLTSLVASANVTGDVIRSVAEKNKSVNVTVSVVTSVKMEGESTNFEIVAPGVVMSADGLVVLPNLVIDQGSAKVEGVTTKVESVTIHLSGGVDAPGKVVLRDPDRGIAFIKPVKALAAPQPFVNFAPGGKVGLGDDVLLIGDLGRIANHGVKAVVSSIVGVVEKPRTLLILPHDSIGEIGNVAFNDKGECLGVVTVKQGSRGGASVTTTNPYDEVLLYVVTGSDIAEAAAQIPAK